MIVISAGGASFALCGCQKMSGNHPGEFKKRSPFIVSARDKTISVVAVCICNPNCSAVGING
jgi:hypothetical protein